MTGLSIVDLALAAATICRNCRDYGRPLDESDQEHGDQFNHKVSSGKSIPCEADQLWYLIRRLENTK